VAGGSGMTCHWIHPNVCHIGILHLAAISTTSPQSTCHSAPVSEILSKLDHPRQKKMMSCRFWRWQISVILDFRDPITGSLKSQCLVFEKIAFFCTLATDRQTDESGGLIIIMSRQFLQRHNTVTDSTAPAVQTTNQY